MTKRDYDSDRSRVCASCCPNPKINYSLSRTDPYAIYSKGMPHDSTGFVDKSAICKYINALLKKSLDELNQVPKGGIEKQLDPSSAFNDNVTELSRHINLKNVPKIDSLEYAAYIIELYNMMLARDIKFDDYSSNPIISNAINSLSQLSEYTGPSITNTTIFRGLAQGDVIGPYISQFLYIDFSENNNIVSQKFSFPPISDFLRDIPTLVSCLNGTPTESFGTYGTPRYIMTGRDLAVVIRNAQPGDIFLNVVKILATIGIPMNPELPVNQNISPYNNFGIIDIVSCLGSVVRLASLVAMCNKNKALFLRPEEGGLIVERNRLNISNNPDISEEIVNNPIMTDILTANGNYLLTQAYPEGAELASSWPSINASIAAAQSIVIKFFYKMSDSITLFAPDNTGSTLVNSGFISTVRNEIDKLVSNCGYGNSWAGTQYRIDVVKGIKLGEKVAIDFLRKHSSYYPQKVKVHIKRFNGKTVIIEN